MRLALERRSMRPFGQAPLRLAEVVTPRTNAASLTSAENFFAALAVAEPFSLELTTDHASRRFLIRTASPAMHQHLEAQLGAAYPQAELRPVQPELDPAGRSAEEQVVACACELRGPIYLPIRTFTDAQVDAEGASLADPVLGVLGALPDLPPGWRGLSQLVLQPAPEDWSRRYLRLSVQHPLAHEHLPQPTESSRQGLALLVSLLIIALIAVQGYWLYAAGQWVVLAALGLVTAVGACIALVLLKRCLSRAIYDAELVREKVSRVAYRAELRLAVFAPCTAPPAEVRARLDRLVAAYRHYNLAAGNGFRPRRLEGTPRGLWRRVGTPLEPGGGDLREPRPIGSARRLAILTTRELAGLWHLPHAAADVPLLERTSARRWLPMPSRVADGCRIGVSAHQGLSVPVALEDALLRRHLLLVAKTRRGKSSLMLRLAQHAMQAEPRQAVLLVDPHTDLAETALGLVPRHRWRDAVYLDLAEARRPFGLNLIDTGLGWDRDTAVSNALAIFQREWEGFWGPRMEDAFRFALLTLFEANRRLCAQDPLNGRGAQYTILDVPVVLCDAVFRRRLLEQVDDPAIKAWWAEYFDPMERRFQLEIANPVLSKLHRFEGSLAAAQIVGQPCSTINPVAWLAEGNIVVVNTAKGSVGESTAALIGASLLNLVALAIGQQAKVEPSQRRDIRIFVDEFHTMPGADYEAVLAELSKYGASLVLATQSLARLDTLEADRSRGLRASVFANLDGVFAFHCSAEDARYLVPELGGAIDEQDLIALGEHQCYVRISSAGQRLPTFSVKLDPPPQSDPSVRTALMTASAQRYGRVLELVVADRHAARARIEAMRQSVLVTLAAEPASVKPARNQHRRRKAATPHTAPPEASNQVRNNPARSAAPAPTAASTTTPTRMVNPDPRPAAPA